MSNYLNGHVENISGIAYYTFKKLVRPDENISFSHIYNIAKKSADLKEEDLLEFVKDRFNDRTKWKIVVSGEQVKQDVNVVNASTGKRRSGKVRAVGGVIETASAPETASEGKDLKDMSHVTGLQVEQERPEITAETLLACEDLSQIKKLITSIRGKREREQVVKGAILLASNRGKDEHYRAIKGIMEKLSPMDF